jgi:hypothetical protein
MDIHEIPSWQKLEETIRQEPTKSVLLAVLTGFILCLLPVGRLISLFVKLLFVLTKPALFVLGVVKLFEVSGISDIDISNSSTSKSTPKEPR